jgi:hypothetical protein
MRRRLNSCNSKRLLESRLRPKQVPEQLATLQSQRLELRLEEVSQTLNNNYSSIKQM